MPAPTQPVIAPENSATLTLTYHEIRAILIQAGHITGATYRVQDGTSVVEKLLNLHNALDVHMISQEEYDAFVKVIGGADRAEALLGRTFESIQSRVR